MRRDPLQFAFQKHRSIAAPAQARDLSRTSWIVAFAPTRWDWRAKYRAGLSPASLDPHTLHGPCSGPCLLSLQLPSVRFASGASERALPSVRRSARPRLPGRRPAGPDCRPAQLGKRGYDYWPNQVADCQKNRPVLRASPTRSPASGSSSHRQAGLRADLPPIPRQLSRSVSSSSGRPRLVCGNWASIGSSLRISSERARLVTLNLA